jgi:hypothetical protein
MARGRRGLYGFLPCGYLSFEAGVRADFLQIIWRGFFASWATFSLGTMALAVATFVVRTARAIAPRTPAPPPAPPFTRRTHLCGAR